MRHLKKIGGFSLFWLLLITLISPIVSYSVEKDSMDELGNNLVLVTNKGNQYEYSFDGSEEFKFEDDEWLVNIYILSGSSEPQISGEMIKDGEKITLTTHSQVLSDDLISDLSPVQYLDLKNTPIDFREGATLSFRFLNKDRKWSSWTNSGDNDNTQNGIDKIYGIDFTIRNEAIFEDESIDENDKIEGELSEKQGTSLLANDLVADNEGTLNKSSLKYQVHVQSSGWQGWKADGETAGTVGQAKRLEGIKIDIGQKGIEYRTHVQSYGWQGWAHNGELSGTTGEAKRLEAIEIKLSEELSTRYTIAYRVHAEKLGWLGWAKDGESAGTAGLAYRLEAIEIQIMDKNSSMIPNTDVPAFVTQPTLQYRTHIQTYGWENGFKEDGQLSGTIGQSKRLEGIQIQLSNANILGSVEYRSHIQTIGWESNYKKDGQISGTVGQAKRLEAIQIRLTGYLAQKYDIYYRVHSQSFGWLGWARNGDNAGTTGYAKRLEAIEMKLVQKGMQGPALGEAFKDKAKPLTGIKIYLDAGHGGKDSGAIGVDRVTLEKNLNLSVSKKVKSNLEALGAHVIMRRTGDVYAELKDISKSANASGADIFISIHHNSSTNSSIAGIETYDYNIGRQILSSYNLIESDEPEEASFFYASDNYSIPIGENVLAERSRLSESRRLANNVHKSLLANTGAKNRNVHGADFHVVRETKMPAILCELGYMSNVNELQLLKQSGYQDKLARGISEGVIVFYQ